MKNYLPLLIILAIFSCRQTKNQETTNLIELQQDSLKLDFYQRFSSINFNDSLCNEGIELAKELAANNNFRFYAMEAGMDSSSTPTVILRDELNFKILGEYDKDISFRYCYNQATLNFFNEQKGFNAFDYVKDQYDSLFELELTEEPPLFNDGKIPNTLDKYIYCNLDLSIEEPPYNSVSLQFRITKEGKLKDLEIAKSNSHKNDSIVYNLIKDPSNKWSPRRMHGGGTSWYEFYLIFEYDPANVQKHCI